MSKFEAVTGGNIANTPISRSTNMSPSEMAAFSQTGVEDTSSATATYEENAEIVYANPEFNWETLAETTWNEPMFGQAISNSFRRITRRAAVPGGYLYSVATYGLCYVRGTANSNTSETLTFVPNSANQEAAEPAPKTKSKK